MAVDCPGHADVIVAPAPAQAKLSPVTAFSRALRAGNVYECRAILDRTDEKTLPSALAIAMVQVETARKKDRFEDLMQVFVTAGQRSIDATLARALTKLDAIPQQAEDFFVKKMQESRAPRTHGGAIIIR